MKAGQLIAELRKFRGKTRQELAELLGVTKQRMGALEASEDVAHSTINRVCAALNFEIIARPKELRPAKQPTDITLSGPG